MAGSATWGVAGIGFRQAVGDGEAVAVGRQRPRPNMKARLVDLGGTVLALSPANFGRLIADDTEKWGKVIKFAGIKPQ